MTRRMEAILFIVAIIIAVIGLFFGDNIYQQITGQSAYKIVQPIFVSDVPATPGGDDLQIPPSDNSQPASNPPTLGNMIFDENFDNNNNLWPTGKNPNNYEVYLDNGEYHIVGEPNGTGMWFGVSQITNLDDFYLETKTRLIGDSLQTSDYGVHFRQSNLINYIFVIDPDQQSYALLLVDRPTDKYTPLMPWVYSPKILKGFETNTIGILCTGSTITIYINGYRVDSINSNSSLSGAIGFVGGTGEHVAIDYLRIWALK